MTKTTGQIFNIECVLPRRNNTCATAAESLTLHTYRVLTAFFTTLRMISGQKTAFTPVINISSNVFQFNLSGFVWLFFSLRLLNRFSTKVTHEMNLERMHKTNQLFLMWPLCLECWEHPMRSWVKLFFFAGVKTKACCRLSTKLNVGKGTQFVIQVTWLSGCNLWGLPHLNCWIILVIPGYLVSNNLFVYLSHA